MQLDIDVVLDFDLTQGDAALLMIEAAKQHGQHILGSALDIRGAELRKLGAVDPLDQRILARVSNNRLQTRYAASVKVTRADRALEQLAASPMDALPAEALPYLRPSRFCPSDMFGQIVSKNFAHLHGGAMVAAMRDWVGAALSYVPGSSDASTSAMDTYNAREGVCRDYAHLVCSFARAAGIPARYVSGYGPDVTPQDFHAVAEVWLEGGWHLVDATGMSTPNTLIVIGAGRDCGDVAFLETQNHAEFRELRVCVSRA
ncbi:transglutaminase-like domain-containing protein [Roseinatronobacter bogoriensis]|uniref:Transglutaminase family protein n=1 Tax=Roseinatronobacter bogoriensis subsp. barguzinensis TaxID=441209 RepID=A0A2K8KK50_9RHOB|nr:MULTISPECIES: transglutaminase family protein [Rhodobaca]ATX67408.1 transglutaminase family protein [Rhodobaca barguzinensis]MBB4206989.1 transglutaminase-like putative cysteine protease [Rhodobaca bogoriensis DSM 18756]TDW36079.1 transglutaminase superfamily protein [Rhodobaca barguzinensis]TDY74092.1 transglutaminase superfamily protein [Rhodobaca bogoriensis DSM 18756]